MSSREYILEALKEGPKTNAMLMEECYCGDTAVINATHKLREEGKIVTKRIRNGRSNFYVHALPLDAGKIDDYLVPYGCSTRAKIMMQMKRYDGPVTVVDISGDVGINSGTVGNALRTLRKLNAVESHRENGQLMWSVVELHESIKSQTVIGRKELE